MIQIRVIPCHLESSLIIQSVLKSSRVVRSHSDPSKIMNHQEFFLIKSHTFSSIDISKLKQKNDNFNKRQKYVSSRSNEHNHSPSHLVISHGQLILERKNIQILIAIRHCVNVYLLLRCHNRDQTCLVGLKSQKSGMGPIWYTRPSASEHWGLWCAGLSRPIQLYWCVVHTIAPHKWTKCC